MAQKLLDGEKYANQKKKQEQLLSPDQADSKGKDVIRDNEGHFITIKESVLLEDKTILHVCVPNNRGKTDRTLKRNRFIHQHSYSHQHPLSETDRSRRQQISKDPGPSPDKTDISQTASSNNSRLHIILKLTQSIHQGRPTFWA